MQKNLNQHKGYLPEWPFAASNTFCSVAIGYASGGFEALKELINNLPNSIYSMSFFVAQPIENEQFTALTAVLPPCTGLSIKRANHLELIQPGIIYTVNLAQTMELTADGHIKVMPIQTGEAGSFIDNLFQSLALCSGQSSVAIVLSGTGSDGAAGVKFIRHAGGKVLIQRPQTANYNSMPLAAIATKSVNEILPVYDMGKALLKIYMQHIGRKSLYNIPEKSLGKTAINIADNSTDKAIAAQVKVQQHKKEKYDLALAKSGIEAMVKDAIFNSYHHTYIVLDNVNNIIEVNGDTALYFNTSISPYINKNIWQILNEAFKQDVHTAFTNALVAQQLAAGHVKFSVINGRIYFFKILIKILSKPESMYAQYVIILEKIETDQLINTNSVNSTVLNAIMPMPAI